ncbi:MAG: DOMON domain-containing protein [Planctomycetota bacterium]|jgi:hypothetical protein
MQVIPTTPDRPLCLDLVQAWLGRSARPQDSGRVELWSDARALHVRAHLTGAAPATTASADQQRLWQLGDVFEVFIKDCAADDYHEVHVAPGGQRLHLRIEDGQRAALRAGTLEPEACLAALAGIDGRAHVGAGGWRAELSLAWAALGITPQATLAINCARYAYRGAQVEHSATAALRLLDYHRHEDYQRFRCD